MRIVIILSLIFFGSTLAQPRKVVSQHAANQTKTETNTAGQTWEIPFASKDNTISLSIQNNSSLDTKNVSVTFMNLPSWLEFKSNTAVVKSISAKGSGDAEFIFSVDKKAPVGKDTTMTATIRATDGQCWTKDIKVLVGAPKDYKLYDNFPNPFNPSTKIGFELPVASHVRLVIYDVVGREVAQIADADYPAGYTELTWNGMNRNGQHVSSGVYFYRISTENSQMAPQARWNKVMKMLMLK